MALKSSNTLQQPLKKMYTTQELKKSGIYKIACNTCHKACIGQTSRSLKQRFQEHHRYIQHNDPRSAYVCVVVTCAVVSLVSEPVTRFLKRLIWSAFLCQHS
jgi:hypothetical protein